MTWAIALCMPWYRCTSVTSCFVSNSLVTLCHCTTGTSHQACTCQHCFVILHPVCSSQCDPHTPSSPAVATLTQGNLAQSWASLESRLATPFPPFHYYFKHTVNLCTPWAAPTAGKQRHNPHPAGVQSAVGPLPAPHYRLHRHNPICCLVACPTRATPPPRGAYQPEAPMAAGQQGPLWALPPQGEFLHHPCRAAAVHKRQPAQHS